MTTLIYFGKAHRLQVGDQIIEHGVPTEVTAEVAEALDGRPDIQWCEDSASNDNESEVE